jgi:DNA invertase Pin-like site-specific DNA recombinase
MIKAGKRVAIYTRVSTKDKGQATEGQRRELERWAENCGLHCQRGVYGNEFVLYEYFSKIKSRYFARFFDGIFCGVFV